MTSGIVSLGHPAAAVCIKGLVGEVTDRPIGAKEHSVRALVGAAHRDLHGITDATAARDTVKVRSQKLKPLSRSVFLEH